ncbi:hypothetical protein GUJ93_ZPchr0015g6853 [Zizania palustris]|uniref:Uncharacterized protein n=1 Tax=Zizania palustris TaxID=103762 RepID=A0A8J5TGI5_ZIZPA|nr:hypothetical protein GUJ93_ZPchr0015g6853 [Zizania palustris]
MMRGFAPGEVAPNCGRREAPHPSVIGLTGSAADPEPLRPILAWLLRQFRAPTPDLAQLRRQLQGPTPLRARPRVAPPPAPIP